MRTPAYAAHTPRLTQLRSSKKRIHTPLGVYYEVREEFRLRRIFAHSAPDKRACRSSSGECELPRMLRIRLVSLGYGVAKKEHTP